MVMVGSIIVFIIVLSILVLAHEAGHFFMARRLGVLVEEFGFGLPPRIIGKKIGKTIYSINLFPFGGFVRLHGENTEEDITRPKQAFLNKSKKARAAILTAGVIMNFILAILAFGLVYSFSGIPRETKDVRIADVAPGSPAQVSGLFVGDIVKTIDKVEVSSVDQFIELVGQKKGKKTQVVIERSLNGEKSVIKLSLTPRENPPADEGPLGVVISTTEIYFPPIWQRPFIGMYYGFKDALFWGKTIIDGFGKIFTELFAGHTPKDLAGPVGIFAVTSQAAKQGVLTLINFIGILSVNLAILNIIPFPALDGGRLLFVVIETIFGKKILPKVEATIHTIGMIILLTLVLGITAHDIQGLIRAGSLSAFINSMVR
jgi:regulator of sigma E protease